MTVGTLAAMSLGELSIELKAAGIAVEAAEYQEGLSSYMAVRDAALARKAAVEAEIDRRLGSLGLNNEVPANGE